MKNMILNSGKCLVKMRWIRPNEWLAILSKERAMIVRGGCCRPYSTKEKIKKKTRQKVEVVQQTPEVAPEKVEGKSELTKSDEVMREIIEKSKNEKKMKANAGAATERSKKYPKISDYFIQNMMDFPLHKPADFDDCVMGETSPELINSFPSISTILNETSSVKDRIVLDRWKKKMILQLGETEFYNQQTEKTARGNQFHSIIKKCLLGEDFENLKMSDDVKGCLESVSNVLGELSDAKLVESSVYHPLLYYKGNIDCIANYRNEWHVIEWKVGETAKKSLASTYTAPVQTCAYMGTLSWCKNLNVNEPISKGLIVFALADGSPAQVFPINPYDSQIFWDQWLGRLQMFWGSRSNRKQSVAEEEQSLDQSENSDSRDS